MTTMKSIMKLLFLFLLLLAVVSPTSLAVITKPKQQLSKKHKNGRRKKVFSFLPTMKKRKQQAITPTKDSSTLQQKIDYDAIGKYIVAISVQVTSMYLVWNCLDWFLVAAGFDTNNKGLSSIIIPRWVTTILIYIINIQAGKFNPLPNVPEQRQQRQQQKQRQRQPQRKQPQRKQPSWTPPGWVFVIAWPFFVFGTRAYTMAIIVEKVGYKFANPVTLSMMIHFGFASLWNSINRVENRLGVSMVMLYGLVITKAITAYIAYKIDRTAGIILATTLSWICAAAALGTSVWKLNPEDKKTGKLEPLYPVVVKR